MFLLSGLLIIIGLAVPRRSIGRDQFRIEAQGAELAGLIFLGTTLVINAAAAVYVNGLTPGLAIYVAVGVACIYRARVILSPAVEIVPVEIVSTDSTIKVPLATKEQTDIPPDDYVSREE